MNNDEKYCFSRGEVIKKEAEICPKCGVNQLKRNNTSALEVHCFSCGEVIKKEAEICPKCGVRQIKQSSQTGELFTQNGNERQIDKIMYTVVSFFLGYIGVDRFLRGQILFGILKIVDFTGVFAIIDFIIALTQLSKYDKNFVFIDGLWKE